ncbi:unnamed protein product [Paramecium primaurelia]|uniref:Uncharacterized protein n=1 Tax=Paramecium primaurelia TaxID=5886 RepID=A0A8S1NJW6_PARPR|nr:unnamed protein product [Paramecium primaurelia]
MEYGQNSQMDIRVEKLINGLFFEGKFNIKHLNKCNTQNIDISRIPNNDDDSDDDKTEDQDIQGSIKIGQSLLIIKTIVQFCIVVNIVEVNKLLDGMGIFRMIKYIIKIQTFIILKNAEQNRGGGLYDNKLGNQLKTGKSLLLGNIKTKVELINWILSIKTNRCKIYYINYLFNSKIRNKNSGGETNDKEQRQQCYKFKQNREID